MDAEPMRKGRQATLRQPCVRRKTTNIWTAYRCCGASDAIKPWAKGGQGSTCHIAMLTFRGDRGIRERPGY